jgi:hypothetical protein
MSTIYSTEATPKQVQFLLSLWKQLNEVVVDTQDPASNWSGDDDQTLKADTLLGKTLTELDKPAVTKFVNGNKVNLSTAEVIGYTEAGGAIEKSEISTAIDVLKRLLDSAKADRATWGLPSVAPEWASKYPSVPSDAEKVVPARFASKCSVCGKRDQYIAYLKAGWHALCQNCAHNDGKIDDAIDKSIQQVLTAVGKGNAKAGNVGLAVADPDELDGFAYYRVSRSGIAKVIGGSHFNSVQDLPQAKQEAVLTDLLKRDLPALARAFGIQFKVCGVCGRTLKDEHSRAIGIGSDCLAGLG